jgi:DNA/RNA endonuclease G (NUC1)
MSNIVPQQRKGHVVWGKLENEHRYVVSDASKGIKAVWLISGPVFLNGQAEKVIGPDRVGAPHAVYKIIGWQKADGKFAARGYIIKQETGLTSSLTWTT